MDKKIVLIVVVLILLMGGYIGLSGNKEKTLSVPEEQVEQIPEKIINLEEEKGEKMTEEQNTLKKPDMQIDASKTYQAVLSTSEGEITISLQADKTPITVNNFVYLTQQGFYDKTVFHRVIKGFMIQGGDPEGNGTGGPGYKFNDEPFEGEYSRGVVAMANSGPNTNGSQFFIMHQDYALPPNYVIFGEVAEGLEVVDKIAEAPTASGAMGENSKPVNPVTIDSVKILEK